MPIRYVVRPAAIRTTPLALKTALGAERTVRYPGPSRRLLSWERDFFLTYPPLEYIEEARPYLHAQQPIPETLDSTYGRIRYFAVRTKAEQRLELGRLGFAIPKTITGMVLEPDAGSMGEQRWVVRPWRHSEGRDYRVITTEEALNGGYNPHTEYISQLFPKTHEYRILIVRGEPLITLLKTVPEDTPVEAPWNHAHGASFVTVNDWNNNRLRHTNVYDLIRSNQEFFKNVDLGGLDVLFNRNDRSFVVCELNLCPSLSIQANLERVASHVLSVPR